MSEQVQASIIIPIRDEWSLTWQCIQSLRQYTEISHEIIMINNGSISPVPAYFHHLKDQMITNRWNRGFAAAINQGLQVAKGKYLIWLNNDTLPSHRWLKQLIYVLESDQSVGLVGPVSNKVIPEQKIKVNLTSPTDIHAFSDRYNQTDPDKWRESLRLSGFCLVYSREVFEQVGFLDERYGLGTYEDDDYCYRVRQSGYRCMIAGDTYVHHFGSQSFKKNGYPEFKKILKQNRRYYIHKWGRLPESK